jgi:hypothetical protein
MFQITKQVAGRSGSFVKLVRSDSEDYVVILRSPADGRLHHRYMGPDLLKAEEIFAAESAKLGLVAEAD